MSGFNVDNIRNDHVAAGFLGRTRLDRAGSGMLDVEDDEGTLVEDVAKLFLSGARAYDLGNGEVLVVMDANATFVGELTGDGSPSAISLGADNRAFPGVAKLTNPAVSRCVVGDQLLLVYRHGSTHLADGKIVGRIGTITDDAPWTISWSAEFDILDVANDLRCEDSVSVLDIDGAGDYRIVIAFREYNGTVNLTPGVLVSDVAADVFTSTDTFTRHNIALSGHTQDFVVGRVHKLQGGRFMVAFGYISGTTHVNGVAWTLDVEDWSAPTFVNINNSTSARDEINFEEMPDGSLIAHIRNDTSVEYETSHSTDAGTTWTAPASLFSATGWPMFRRLTSGIGFSVNRSLSGGPSYDTYYRQTQDLLTDTGWGAEVALDTTASYHSAYATGIQLDDNHFLVIWATEADGAIPVDSDLYSSVFTDSSVFGAAAFRISSADTTSGFPADKIVAGSGIEITVLNPGGDEQLEVAAPEILDIPTSETNAALVLAPDGAGGVEFRAETSGASATDPAIWRPLMDGLGNVITDSATGEAIMAFGPA